MQIQMNLRSSMWKEWSYSENHMINSVQRQYGDYFYAVGGWYWLKGISVGLLRSWWCSISWCRCKSQNSVHFVKMHEALHWWYCPFPHGYYILYFSKYAYYMLYFSEKKKKRKTGADLLKLNEKQNPLSGDTFTTQGHFHLS